MQPIEITGKEVYEKLQWLIVQVNVLLEKADRSERREKSKANWWATAAAWAAVAIVLVKEFL